MILESICFSIIGIWMLFFIYIRIRYPFWSQQPVCHIYDLFRRNIYLKPYIIQSKNPIRTKYVDFTNVLTKPFLDLTKEELGVVVEFIQCHYLSSEFAMLLLSENILRYIMSGHIEQPYISILYETQMKLILNEDHTATNVTKIITEKNPIGVMGSYSLHFYLVHEKDIPFQTVSYWDFISIHRNHSEPKNIHRLIQTHDYNQRIEGRSQVSLFKKEGDLCAGVVPLINYNSYLFLLHAVSAPPLEPHVTCIRIQTENFHLVSDTLYNISRGQTNHSVDLACFPSLSALQDRIQHNIYYIYVVRKKEEILGIFIFKDVFQYIEDQGNILECTACFTNSYGQEEEGHFFARFLCALHDIQKNVEKKYSLLQLNDLGHSILLLDKWKWKYAPMQTTECGYYLYNAWSSKMPFNKPGVFIIN